MIERNMVCNLKMLNNLLIMDDRITYECLNLSKEGLR